MAVSMTEEADLSIQTGHQCSSTVLGCLKWNKSNMIIPTMWCVQPAKPQISLRICAVWSEPLLVA